MKKSGLIYIILASVLWGTSGIFVKYLAPYGVTSLQMTFIRGLVAFVSMGIFVLIKDKRLVKTNFKEIFLFMGSGISFFLTASCYYQSMQLTSVSTAVVLMYTAPIFVLIYSTTFLGERLSYMKLIAVTGMIVGCCLVSGIIGGLKIDAVEVTVATREFEQNLDQHGREAEEQASKEKKNGRRILDLNEIGQDDFDGEEMSEADRLQVEMMRMGGNRLNLRV